MVNWWLIAVIVVAAIAAIIGLIYLFYYAFSLFKDFEEKIVNENVNKTIIQVISIDG